MKSIVQTDDKCYLCHTAFGSDTHHIFGGANRRKSDEDGLTVRLCRNCHDDVHFDKDTSAELMYRLHKDGQEAYERTHTRDEFMARYGRNYL